MSLYLWLHILTVAFPLIRSFEPRVAYASRWKFLFPAIVLTAIFFLVWDVRFTRNGVWGFNEDYLAGIYLGNLPLEECLFFFTVPFASVFIYDCVLYFDGTNRLKSSLRWLSATLGVLFVVLAFVYSNRDYTFFTFLFTGILLLLHGLVFNAQYMGHFFFSYLVHLLPFILVNGILTGGVAEEPIVWYNNNENLAIRVWTIPLEDFVYAMLLLLMNVSFYELFKSGWNLKSFRKARNSKN